MSEERLIGTWHVRVGVLEPWCWSLQEQCVHGVALVGANECEAENYW